MTLAVMLLILGGLVAAMAVTLGQLRSALDVPSCPRCPHCQQLAHEARLREQDEFTRLEQRIGEYERPDDRDQHRGGR